MPLQFAPKHFSKTLKLDFMQTPELSTIFDDDLSPSSIIRNAEIAGARRSKLCENFVP
jgi:hypothetical protein